MSEEEEGHMISHSRSNNNRNHRYPRHHHHQPLVRNEDSAASLLEYSQSSEEGYSSQKSRGREHSRENTSSSGLLATSSSTSFRFRDDLTQSSRIVRFGPTSDSELSGEGLVSSASARQIAAEEGAASNFRNNSNAPSGGQNNKKSKSSHSRHRNRHHHHEHHRGGEATVNRETFLSTSNRWMTQLAYSFSTPPAPKLKKQLMLKEEDNKQQSLPSPTQVAMDDTEINYNSSNAPFSTSKSTNGGGNTAMHQMQQRAPQTTKAPQNNNNNNNSAHSENSPLLPLQEDNDDDTATFPRQHHLRHSFQHGHQKLFPSTHLHRHSFDQISIAVAFLKDYEAGRPPTLPSNVSSITPWQMGLYRVKFSSGYSVLLGFAMVALFLSSALEGPSPTDSNLRMHMLSALNLYACMMFGADMWIRSQFQSLDYSPPRPTAPRRLSPSKTFTALPVMVQTRKSQANLLTRPLFLFGVFLCLENLGWLLASPDRTFVVLYSSISKPIVLYYISRQARHAMEALARIARTVIRVLLIEVVLILSFAAVACRLFQDFESFDHLSIAWLSLFKCTYLAGTEPPLSLPQQAGI